MMKEITKQGEEAEKQFFEFEEKRMKLEAKLESNEENGKMIMNYACRKCL